MNVWKKNLVPILFALGSVGFVIAAVAGRVIRGEAINHTFLTFAFVFSVFAVIFFGVGRKSGGGSDRPGA